MVNILECLPPNGRIAVIRLRSLGDCVLTTPALDLLKQARPDLRVAVVVEARFRAVFEGNADVDMLLEPRVPALRAWSPHLCLNLHGGATSARLTALSGARWRAGFAHFRQAFVYNVRIPRAQDILRVDRKVHTAEHLASAVFYLGAPVTEVPRAKLYAEPAEASAPYAVIHPLASQPDKTWPASKFVAVARHLRRAMGLELVFIAGPGEDLSAFGEFRTMAGAPLARIKSLLRGAALFVGNDSGPAHMAAAFGLPVVALFGASDAAIWRPWKTPCEVLRGDIADIPEQDVLAALDRLWVHA